MAPRVAVSFPVAVITIPLGILYRVFGVKEWTTIVLPLIASTASVPAVCLSR